MVTPFITFAGNCREALEFYQEVFDTTIQMSMTYDEYIPEGVNNPPKDLSNWILHATMEICGTEFWFADEVAEPVTKGTMVKLTAKVPTAANAQKIYNALCKDAYITLPPTGKFYSTFHAGLIDMFGISWQIVALEAPEH